MFYKPAAAFQKRVEEANGSRANLMVDRADDKRTPEQAADWLSKHLKH